MWTLPAERQRDLFELGNNVPHLHAHIQPRYHGDPYPGGVVNPTTGQSVTLENSEARDQVRRIRATLGGLT